MDILETIFIVIMCLIAGLFIFLAVYFGVAMNGISKKNIKYAETFPRFYFSNYDSYFECKKCNKINDNNVCSKCGVKGVEVVGRWKIKEHCPPPLLGAFGEILYIGKGYAEKVDFEKADLN